jgi:hypothetical protein
MLLRRLSNTTAAVMLGVPALRAQSQPPPGSPPKTATGMVGGKTITIDYFAPYMRGRKIFGALVPYDEVWCPGANWATAVKSPQAGLRIGDMKLAAGEYAIWINPSAKEWTAILNRDAKAFHLDYKPSGDIGKLTMTLKNLSDPVEQLTWEVRSTGEKSGALVLTWERTEASIPFTLE